MGTAVKLQDQLFKKELQITPIVFFLLQKQHNFIVRKFEIAD